MQILEHGFYRRVIKCNCGCKFMYDKDDIFSIEKPMSYVSPSNTYKIYYVRCPECNDSFSVPEKVVELL